MKKSIALISVFVVLTIAFSGCVDNNSPAANETGSETSSISEEDVAGISTLETLPAGFEYIDTIPLSTDDVKSDYEAENISGVLNVSEGIYKDVNGTNYYIDVIELEDEETANNFINAYKSSFTPLSSGSRFTDESFNGHSAVKILDYITSGGDSVTRFTYVWSNENYVLIVFGNTAEEAPVRQLAEATGY